MVKHTQIKTSGRQNNAVNYMDIIPHFPNNTTVLFYFNNSDIFGRQIHLCQNNILYLGHLLIGQPF